MTSFVESERPLLSGLQPGSTTAEYVSWLSDSVVLRYRAQGVEAVRKHGHLIPLDIPSDVNPYPASAGPSLRTCSIALGVGSSPYTLWSRFNSSMSKVTSSPTPTQ